MKLKKFIAGVALVAALSLGSIVTTKTVEAAGGNVFDGNQREIVGMWVEVSGGKSGWAKLTNTRLKYSKGWSYDTQGKKWKADVGVNGTPRSWTINARGLNWTYRQDGSVDVWVNQSGHYGWRTVVPR